MTRVRSPAYPSHALPEAIDYVRKIHEQDRQHPVARSVAAQHMGFSGLTGTSDRALSSLLHYGLAEKAAKGELRVADAALHILFPDNDRERRAALNLSGFTPQLFQELRARYAGRPPAAATLESFLTREGFATVAIGPATKAYLETCRFLEQEGAYESDTSRVGEAAESAPDQRAKENRVVEHQTIETAGALPTGLRRDVYTLSDGGEVTLSLPAVLSQRDYEDLQDWLDLMGRKAKRAIAPTPKTAVVTARSSEGDKEADDDI